MDAATFQAVVGENVRRLRTGAGATLDEVARLGRNYGLKWSASRVQELERGALPVSAALLIAVADMMRDVTGTPVTVRELLAGSGFVQITPTMAVTRESVRDVLSGSQVDFRVSDMKPVQLPDNFNQLAAALTEATKGMDTLLPPPPHLGPGEIQDTIVAIGGVAERHAARKLRVPVQVVVAWAFHLWERTLTAERDRRAPVTANAQARGRITRDLIAEIDIAMKEHRRGDG